MHKITPWIKHEGALMRHIVGHDINDIRYRVAIIEKSPRVRIRENYLRESHGRYEDGGEYLEYKWAEHLDWCYGDKGSGPDDEESRAWCDAMLKALGYQQDE